MQTELTKGKKCDYLVNLSFTDAEKAGVRTHVLEHFAKDMNVPGYI